MPIVDSDIEHQLVAHRTIRNKRSSGRSNSSHNSIVETMCIDAWSIRMVSAEKYNVYTSKKVKLLPKNVVHSVSIEPCVGNKPFLLALTTQ